MKIILTVISLALFPLSVIADWNLNSEASNLHFVSIKKGAVGEVHTFNNISGSIKSGGNSNVVVKLASVDTLIPIRNERMKTMLFNVAKFPEAVISANVDVNNAISMKTGESQTQKVSLSINLHGQKQKIDTVMQVVKLSDNKIMVATIRPIIIKADQFKLANGIEKLREVAKLPSISTAVPVTASLIFEK